MSDPLRTNVTRRYFLAGSAASLMPMPRASWLEEETDLGLCWTLDDSGDTATESVHRSSDPISSRTGHAVWVGQGRERALRFDGYSVWIDHAPSHPPIGSGPLTVCAWIGLEAYPVTEAAVVQSGDEQAGFRLSIDRFGFLHVGVSAGGAWKSCVAKLPVTRGGWTHIAATISNSAALALYRDGELSGELVASDGSLAPAANAEVVIGRLKDGPAIGNIFPTGVVNGLVKDIRIYKSQISRSSIEEIMNGQRPRKAPDLQINGRWCADDRQRPAYHAKPPRAWTNEPHGLIHWQGTYHLFYQKNGNGPYWGNINWGHMTSPDLYRWTEMPAALSPEAGADSEGCWSGSVIDHQGKLAILYTGSGGHGAGICLALSSDGLHFQKHPGNPVIPQPPAGGGYPEFRDPFVWRENDKYYLIIGSAVKGVGGTALLYHSMDLVHWEFKGPLLVGDRESSGVFWEMPIFVKIGDKHVLIVCEVPGRSSYWVGTWKDEVFTSLTKEPHRLELFNHLLSPTPHVTATGQVVTMAIIPDQRSPKECWQAGWAHLYSIPRTLSLDGEGRLCQQPFQGIDAWCEPPASQSNIVIAEGHPKPLEGMSGSCLRIRAVLQRGNSRSVSLVLRRSPDDREKTVLRYEWEIGRLVLDRSQSSLDPLVTRDVQEATYFPPEENSLDLEIFLDESVIEGFIDRRAAFASRIYPTLKESDGLALGCYGGTAHAETVTVARVQKII